jgi:hypothetical protein
MCRSLSSRARNMAGAVWDSVHKKVVLNLNGAPHCSSARRRLGGASGRAEGCGFNLQMTSADGLQWSPPVAIDGFLGRQGHAAAGHAGLELKRGPHQGRLLFIGHRGAYVEDAVWFTDDGGATYQTAAKTLPKMDEAQLVQNKNGTVIANMRWRGSSKQGRGVAASTDGGSSFSAISFDTQLRTPVCQASIWQSSQNGDIYYSAPSSELVSVCRPNAMLCAGVARKGRVGAGLGRSWLTRAVPAHRCTAGRVSWPGLWTYARHCAAEQDWAAG